MYGSVRYCLQGANVQSKSLLYVSRCMSLHYQVKEEMIQIIWKLGLRISISKGQFFIRPFKLEK